MPWDMSAWGEVFIVFFVVVQSISRNRFRVRVRVSEFGSRTVVAVSWHDSVARGERRAVVLVVEVGLYICTVRMSSAAASVSKRPKDLSKGT